MRYRSILVFILLLGIVNSWDWDTHRYIARELCEDLECGVCLEYMINGSIAPDKDFRDPINHHCYSPLWKCPEGDWTCATENHCPALEKTNEWLQKSRNDIGCMKYYDMAVASHYFMDSKVFWHKVKNEDYENCHRPFETQVGNHIDEDQFTVTVCNINVTKAEINNWFYELELELGIVPPLHPQKSTLEEIKELFLEGNGRYILALLAILVFLAVFKKPKKRRRRKR